ncbi:MAG: hypothetical protein WAL85_14620 [Candidatus Korobacteraceae bacterium]
MLRKTILVLFSLFAVSLAIAAQSERAVIKGKSRVARAEGSLEVELADGPAVLWCDASRKDCVELSPGNYEVVRLLAGEGAYKGCPNVDIYRIGADRSKEKPLGKYLVLSLQEAEDANLTCSD